MAKFANDKDKKDQNKVHGDEDEFQKAPEVDSVVLSEKLKRELKSKIWGRRVSTSSEH